VSAENPQPHVLLVECADRPGLVHGITGVLLRHGCNVIGNQEFVESEAGRFFMRTEFTGQVDAGSLVEETRGVLPVHGVARLASPAKRRVVVLVSREHHCLADLLVRNAFGELNCEIQAVISNHETLHPLVEKFDLPFHFVSAEAKTREEHETDVLRQIERYEPDWLVLAKYMRVLTPEFVRRFPQCIVNIHHSFLPAFIGAKPYQQAFERGVKVIGATAHFVTDQLDQGPIIVQQVMPVDHTHSASDMAQAGRDVEQLVLARALKLVFEDRVFLSGNRTIIFD
jgi:formyltetrahydrofolate deformylase